VVVVVDILAAEAVAALTSVVVAAVVALTSAVAV
jgi:hypothetical protein